MVLFYIKDSRVQPRLNIMFIAETFLNVNDEKIKIKYVRDFRSRSNVFFMGNHNVCVIIAFKISVAA